MATGLKSKLRRKIWLDRELRSPTSSVRKVRYHSGVTVPASRRPPTGEPGLLGWIAILFVVYFIVDTLFRVQAEAPPPAAKPALADHHDDAK